MIYIIITMRRTQLYLDDELWNALHARASTDGTTISDLVRTAARERYLGDTQKRQKAMHAIVGMRANRQDLAETETYIRDLRRGSRLDRLG